MTEPLPVPSEHPSREAVGHARRGFGRGVADPLEEAVHGERQAEAQAFLIALAALDGAEPESTQRYELSAKAADALVRLAELDGDSELTKMLRPDPACASATWTVACYRIGDLVPASLCDYTDPVRALRALAHCSEDEHVAAELIASNDQGVQWCALVRSGEQLAFRVPTDAVLTCSDPSDQVHADALAEAVGHWRTRLAALEERSGATRYAPDRIPESPGAPRAAAEIAAVSARLDSLEQRLASLRDHLSDLEARLTAHVAPEDRPAKRTRKAPSSWSATMRRHSGR